MEAKHKNEWMDYECKTRCMGCSMQSLRCGCLQGSLCKTRLAMILAHMVMVADTGGKCKMGLWQRQANKAWQGKAMQNRRFSTTGR